MVKRRWFAGYVREAEAMVKSGDFKYEQGPSVQKATLDKKEASV